MPWLHPRAFTMMQKSCRFTTSVRAFRLQQHRKRSVGGVNAAGGGGRSMQQRRRTSFAAPFPWAAGSKQPIYIASALATH
jgi:hypothetical protein